MHDASRISHAPEINRNRSLTRSTLRSRSIGGLFGAIHTHEDEKKTKTVMVAELRAQWPERRAFMIGDRYHDMQSGRENDCVVVGAAYGYAKPGELDAADVRIERFRDLLGVVQSAAV